jgi:hypothetical protein
MKKTFVIQVEYPDNDVIPSEEVMEVAQECIENHLERYFGANIMDGEYSRIKVKEVTDGFTLVKRMRDAQKERESLSSKITFLTEEDTRIRANSIRKVASLESEVDEYLKKMEDNDRRKALEIENTEFDYGHNVKYYSEG